MSMSRVGTISTSANLYVVPVMGSFFQIGLESGLLKDGRMKKQRCTEEQIIAVLEEQGVGAKVAHLSCKHGISETTFSGRANAGCRRPPQASCKNGRAC